MKAYWGCAIVSISLLAVGQVRALQLAPDAPADNPWVTNSAEAGKRLDQVLQSCVAKARKSYPSAKQRYLDGLLKDSLFTVTTRLHDSAGHEEQVFIAVRSIKDGLITGNVTSPINVVTGYKLGDNYQMPEAGILDWTISKPDGFEEGNCMGKLMDSLEQQAGNARQGR